MPSHISRDDLHHRITNGDRPILVEALGAGFYADAHLPGAINIPPGQVDTLAPALLPDRHASDRRVLHRRRRQQRRRRQTPRRARLQHRRRVHAAARRTGSNTACRWNASTSTPDDPPSRGRLRKVEHRPTQGGRRYLHFNTAERGGSMPADDRKQIAFVLYPGLTPLDLIGPLQTLAPLPRIDPTFEVVVVGERTDAVPTDAVVKMAPSHTFDDAPAPFAIVVPGGGQPTLAACGNQQLIDYVQSAASNAPRGRVSALPRAVADGRSPGHRGVAGDVRMHRADKGRGRRGHDLMPHLGQVPGSLLVTSAVLVMPLGRRRR